MRKLTLILSLIFFTLLPSSAENKFEVMPKKIVANPLNVAVMLTEQLDSTSMVSTCEYYGYVNQKSQEDFTVFKHPNGSIIRIAFTTQMMGNYILPLKSNRKILKRTRIRGSNSSIFEKTEIITNANPSATRLNAVLSQMDLFVSPTIPNQKPISLNFPSYN